jgi:adenosylcobinamide kinase / adenosylcobinamide-phosphate guanylyltransferase
MTFSQCILVTGAARSGKSEWAERLAAESGFQVVYVATAQVDSSDREWQARIQQHQQRRPANWHTEHVPIALSEFIQTVSAGSCLLVDSLGTWLANLLEQDEETWQVTVQELLESVQCSASMVIFVSEETGWGVVPAYPVGRTFRDRLGALTRQIAAVSNPVYLVVAGYALDLRHLGMHPMNS